MVRLVTSTVYGSYVYQIKSMKAERPELWTDISNISLENKINVCSYLTVYEVYLSFCKRKRKYK
jgi:hypothetical protein